MAARIRVLIVATLIVLIGAVAPAGAAAPPDPTTVDQLRASMAYNSDHPDVLRLYRAFFNREPDIGGVSYWINQYNNGATLDDLAWGFSNSTEFRTTYGAQLTNAEFLDIVYRNVLDRAPDQEGFDYWLGEMNNGLTQHGVVRWVVANTEFTTRYPYTDASPDISTLLLGAADIGSGWFLFSSTSGSEASNEQPTTGCLATFNFPRRASHGNLFTNDPGDLVIEVVHDFPAAEFAIERLQEMRTSAAACPTFVDGVVTTTLTPVSFPQYGDDTFAVRLVSTVGSSTSYETLVLVRYGSTLIGVIVEADAPPADAFTEAITDAATNRVISIVG